MAVAKPGRGALQAVLKYMDELHEKPPLIQVGVGSAVGAVSGYVFTRGGKAVASTIGVSFLLVQLFIRLGMDMYLELAIPYLPYALAALGSYTLMKLVNRAIPGAHNLPSLKFKDKTVVITGATSGLGEALAIELYNRGAKVVLVGRSQEKLAALQVKIEAIGGNTHKPLTYVYDLEDVHDEPTSKLFTETFPVDILINNAGLSMRGTATGISTSIFRRVMEVNLFGHITATRFLMPRMSKDGCIIAVSSVQGKLPLPYRSAYSASKHAFQAYFDSLRAENPRMHVLVVSPGYINTGFGSRALDVSGKPIGVGDADQENFAIHRGYIQVDRTLVARDIRDLKKVIEKQKDGIVIDTDEVNNFVTEHRWVLSGFAAGVLIGFGLA